MVAGPEEFSRLQAELLSLGELKVWSALVTILGDLAPGRDDQIPGPTLNLISQKIGIKPAALRVAIHRLRKDGWIESEKVGRISHYRLSEVARRETLAAHPRIYGPFPEGAERLSLILRAGDDEPAPKDWLQLEHNCFLAPEGSDSSSHCIAARLQRVDLPDWARERLIPAPLVDELRQLHRVLSPGPPDKSRLTPLEGLALRVLVLHRWRRLVLRLNPFSFAALGEEFCGRQTAKQVLRWLAALPRHDVTQ